MGIRIPVWDWGCSGSLSFTPQTGFRCGDGVGRLARLGGATRPAVKEPDGECVVEAVGTDVVSTCTDSGPMLGRLYGHGTQTQSFRDTPCAGSRRARQSSGAGSSASTATRRSWMLAGGQRQARGHASRAALRAPALLRKGCRVDLCSALFEACSAFTHVAVCTLAPSPHRDALRRRLRRFRCLHHCSGCFRLERWPGVTCTHWKSAASPRRTPAAVIQSSSASGGSGQVVIRLFASR